MTRTLLRGCTPPLISIPHAIACIAVLTVFMFVPNTDLHASPTVTYLSPLPGSTNVSQRTDIIVRTDALARASVLPDAAQFSVTGSGSGRMTGRVVLSDDGRTLLFLPSHTFQRGEHVSVDVAAHLPPIHFEFTVSALPETEKQVLDRSALALYEFPGSSEDAAGSKAGRPALLKESDIIVPPSLPMPSVKVTDMPASGSVFLSPWKVALTGKGLSYIPSANQYLMILDNGMQPAFYRPTPGIAFDFKVMPNGTLTYYDSDASKYRVLDNAYTVTDSIACGNGYATDPHDIRILPDGHVLLIGLDPEEVDMSAVVPGGNPKATVIHFVIQELDRGRNVVFQWRSADHFHVTDATHEDLTAETIDFAHPNAIDVDTDGNILLSERHMDEITKIDRSTGAIVWRWGGRNNQYTFTNDTLGFSHQHSIVATGAGRYMLFDNGNFHSPQFSRAVEYVLDTQAMTAQLVWQFRHTPDVFTIAMGSVQRLENGNTFIGWGASTLAATEARPDGSTAFEIQFPDSIISYRAFKFPWNVLTSNAGTVQAPAAFSLEQNYPNPFNPSTTIAYTLPAASHVTLKLYDVIGNEVRTLVDGAVGEGRHAFAVEAGGLSSGMYLCRMTAVPTSGTAGRMFTATKKLVLMK